MRMCCPPIRSTQLYWRRNDDEKDDDTGAAEKLKLAAEISSKTAEQRFDKLSNQLVKSAKHIYSEKATYHELTEGMRAWVLKKSGIKKAFHQLDFHPLY